MSVEFKLPDLGENVEGADVVSVLVAEGSVIQAGQNVLELETDKAVVELPSSVGGRVTRVHVKAGDRIAVGSALFTIEDSSGRETPAPKKEEPAAKAPAKSASAETQEPRLETPAPVSAPAIKPASASTAPVKPPAALPAAADAPPPAGPATRRAARELGVNLHQVSGSGPGGRITTEDVQSFVRTSMSTGGGGAAAPPASPALPDFSQWGAIERVALTGIRRKTAEAMSLSWRTIPHVTQFDLADITELEAGRKRVAQSRGDAPGKITMTVLAMKASVAALKAFPQFNSSLDLAGGSVILKRYYNIGVAVDTGHGLLVPVIREADRKTAYELALELEEMAKRARDRKLGLEEMRGASFTITNLGGIGGTAFTPIINHPEVAILGLSRARQEPAAYNGQIALRLMLPLSLSYDHRVIDGADAARFARKLAELLSDPVRLLVEG